MSNSIRHTPISTLHRCKGQNYDKRIANRRFRRLEHMAVMLTSVNFDAAPQRLAEVSNVWDFVGDGKTYYDINTIPKIIRK